MEPLVLVPSTPIPTSKTSLSLTSLPAPTSHTPTSLITSMSLLSTQGNPQFFPLSEPRPRPLLVLLSLPFFSDNSNGFSIKMLILLSVNHFCCCWFSCFACLLGYVPDSKFYKVEAILRCVWFSPCFVHYFFFFFVRLFFKACVCVLWHCFVKFIIYYGFCFVNIEISLLSLNLSNCVFIIFVSLLNLGWNRPWRVPQVSSVRLNETWPWLCVITDRFSFFFFFFGVSDWKFSKLCY